MNRYLRYAVAAAFAAGSLATGVAHAVIEMEPDDSLNSAQALAVTNGSVEVTGILGVTSPDLAAASDVDFYSFEATAGDVVQLDINGGMKDFAAGTRAVDTVIAVFDANGNLLRQNDDADDVDFGSIATSDSRIVDFVVPSTGKYVVGVSSFPRTFAETGGGALTTTSVDPNVGNGSYTLTVAGVTTPPVQQPPAEEPPAEEPPVEETPPAQATRVNIDVRPRDPGVARVYPNADGKITVAILSSRTFNAMKVDKYSLKFGSEGNEASYVGCYPHGIDVNRDRRKDLVCRFDNKKAGFEVGDLEGVLTGTAEGSQFEGRAPLKVVQKGKKRKHQHNHHHHGWDRGHSWHSRGRD
jgi:hypothetical protein